jgi:tetratricopeptide (TPR) repeat protein
MGARTHWGEPRPGWVQRLVLRARAALGAPPASRVAGLADLPLAVRHGALADAYLGAARDADHRRAAAAASTAMDRAIGDQAWWAADVWAHRALWHFEQASMTLQATRTARRIGDLRAAAGDPATARRYYAEAIDEARDIGAEHEQGLAALGLGRALLELGRVTEARRLASAAVDLLDRANAPAGELDAARAVLGQEVPVGEWKEKEG